MSKLDEVIQKGPDAIRAEIARQGAILERQVRSYANARPRSRFAVKAHITKTEYRLRRLNAALERHGETPWELLSSEDQLRELQRREARRPLMDANSDNPLEASIARSRARRGQRIVIDLYDHTDDAEIAECLDALDTLAFSIAPRVERWNEVVGKWMSVERENVS